MFIWFAGGKVRKWESERSLSGHWASFLEEPDFGAIAHVNELAEDAIEQAMEFPSLRLRHVLAIHSVHDPDLRLSGFAFGLVQLVHKCSFILPTSPPLRDHGADSARCPPALIGERVGLFLGKPFGPLKELLRPLARELEDFQLPVMHDFDFSAHRRASHSPTFSLSHFPTFLCCFPHLRLLQRN